MIPIAHAPGHFYIGENESLDKAICAEVSAEYLQVVSSEDYERYSDFGVPAWFRNRENYQSIIQGSYMDIMPMTAEVIPSLTCPFRCNQCSYRPQKEDLGIWDGRGQLSRDNLLMSQAAMETIIDRLAEAGVENIVITGGGEPLSNRDVVLFGLEDAKAKGMNTCLYSNGYLISDATATQLMSIAPTVIRISIYGMEEQGFTAYTGVKATGFGRVFDNIAHLIDAKVSEKADTQISISFLLHPCMFEHLDLSSGLDLFGLFTRHIGTNRLQHISTIRLTPAVDYYDRKQHELDFFKMIFEKAEKEISAFARFGVTLKPYRHRLDDLYKEKEYNACLAAGLYAEVGVDGTMYQCCERLFMPEYEIGNVLSDTIQDIYKSQPRHDVMTSVNCTIKSCPAVCKPHEANKQLASIQDNSTVRSQDSFRFTLWYDLLQDMASQDSVVLGRYNPFES